MSILNGARVAQWVRSLDLTTHTSLSPIRCGFVPSFVNYIKGCPRLAAASDKDYQLLAQGRWFSPGTPASSTTKTGHHDIAEILLKVVLSTKIQILFWTQVGMLYTGFTVETYFLCNVYPYVIFWMSKMHDYQITFPLYFKLRK